MREQLRPPITAFIRSNRVNHPSRVSRHKPGGLPAISRSFPGADCGLVQTLRDLPGRDRQQWPCPGPMTNPSPTPCPATQVPSWDITLAITSPMYRFISQSPNRLVIQLAVPTEDSKRSHVLDHSDKCLLLVPHPSGNRTLLYRFLLGDTIL